MQVDASPLLTDALKQVPSLVVLGWIVWRHGLAVRGAASEFLEHLRQQDEMFTTAIKDVSERSAQAAEHSAKAIERNSELMGRVAGALERSEARSSRE